MVLYLHIIIYVIRLFVVHSVFPPCLFNADSLIHCVVIAYPLLIGFPLSEKNQSREYNYITLVKFNHIFELCSRTGFRSRCLPDRSPCSLPPKPSGGHPNTLTLSHCHHLLGAQWDGNAQTVRRSSNQSDVESLPPPLWGAVERQRRAC